MSLADPRSIPAVEKVLQALGPQDLPRPLVVALVRQELAALRQAAVIPEFSALLGAVRQSLLRLGRSRLQPVINATGVLLHTNLGRAPLSAAAVQALTSVAGGYCNLESDLETGERGARGSYVENALAVLCGAEAATVVNNCAAALVLILRHFTAGRRKEVIISRGELIQIGGGFRIPDILETSGARLREVGTTNHTTADDYARAIGPDSALLLKVHRSNFFMGGFVESPPLETLVRLARRHRLPVVEDLGSGAVLATARFGLDPEPTPAEAIRRGVELVCFSGDKLFGGPQAGIVAGRRRPVAALKREPFFRALRCDKLVLSALQATAEHYLATAGADPLDPTLPLPSMLATRPEELERRAGALGHALAGLPLTVRIGKGRGQVGGGTLPQAVLASVTLDLLPHDFPASTLAARLRVGQPPVMGYLMARGLRLDLRTVFPGEDAALATALRAAMTEPGSRGSAAGAPA